jgi:DNA-binding transcriptional ArsR family regulator
MDSLEAVADLTRRQIVEMLAKGAMSSGEIAACFALSRPAISQHLKVLREANFVRVRTEAQRRIYELDPRGVRDVAAWAARVERFWTQRLGRLESLMREEAKR